MIYQKEELFGEINKKIHEKVLTKCPNTIIISNGHFWKSTRKTGDNPCKMGL